MSFKKGDIVECVDPTSVRWGFSEGELYYVVGTATSGYVRIKGMGEFRPDGGWRNSRFKLVVNSKDWELAKILLG